MSTESSIAPAVAMAVNRRYWDEAAAAAALSLRHAFQGTGAPELYDGPGTYADRTATMENSKEHFRRHPLADILGALLGAGPTIARYREHDSIVWPALPHLRRDDGQDWRMSPGRPRMPLSFSLSAHRSLGASTE